MSAPDRHVGLADLAVVTPSPKLPALHLTRLVMLGYVLMGTDGPIVTATA